MTPSQSNGSLILNKLQHRFPEETVKQIPINLDKIIVLQADILICYLPNLMQKCLPLDSTFGSQNVILSFLILNAQLCKSGHTHFSARDNSHAETCISVLPPFSTMFERRSQLNTNREGRQRSGRRLLSDHNPHMVLLLF
jgi:hypothetical protein